MNTLQGRPGELRATVTITRKATGKVETYQLVGHPDKAVLAEILADDAKKSTDQSKEQK